MSKKFVNPFSVLDDDEASSTSSAAHSSESESSSNEESNDIVKFFEQEESERAQDEDEDDEVEGAEEDAQFEHSDYALFPEDDLDLGGTFPFENLIGDVRSLIIKGHLDPFTSIMFSLSCKKYFNPAHAKMDRSEFRKLLSATIGIVGSTRLLGFCLKHKWRVDFSTAFEMAVGAGQRDFLKHFRSQPDQFNSLVSKKPSEWKTEYWCMSARVRLEDAKVSYWIGKSGNLGSHTIITKIVGARIDIAQLALGAANSGTLLEFSKGVNLKEFIDKPENFEALCVEAAKGGHLSDLEWLLRARKVKLDDVPGKPSNFHISPLKLFPGVEQGAKMMQLLLYLEKKKAITDPTTLEVAIKRALTLGDVEPVAYIDGKIEYFKSKELSDFEKETILGDALQNRYVDLARYIIERLPLAESSHASLYEALFAVRIYSHKEDPTNLCRDTLRILEIMESKHIRPNSQWRGKRFFLDYTDRLYKLPEFLKICLTVLRQGYPLGENVINSLMSYGEDQKESVADVLRLFLKSSAERDLVKLYGCFQLPLDTAFYYWDVLYEATSSLPYDLIQRLLWYYCHSTETHENLDIYFGRMKALGWEPISTDLSNALVSNFRPEKLHWLFDNGFSLDSGCFVHLIDRNSRMSDTILNDLRGSVDFLLSKGLGLPPSILADLVPGCVRMWSRTESETHGLRMVEVLALFHEKGAPMQLETFAAVVKHCPLPHYRPVWTFLMEKNCPYEPTAVLGNLATIVNPTRNKRLERIHRFLDSHGLPKNPVGTQ